MGNTKKVEGNERQEESDRGTEREREGRKEIKCWLGT